jgi:hypothetical protein
MTVELVPIKSIQIGERAREEKHTEVEVNSYVESFKAVGMLNPVSITLDNVLVAGEGRLMAAQKLGWEKILCRRLLFPSTDKVRLLKAELDENVMRKQFTPAEKVKLTQQILEAINAGQIEREDPEVLPVHQAIEMAGTNQTEYYRAKEVLESGNTEVIEQMEAGEITVSAAQKKVRSEKPAKKNTKQDRKEKIKNAKVLDRLGQEVPQHLRDVFADMTMSEAGALLDRACQLVQGCTGWNRFIRVGHVSQLKDLRNVFQDLVPYALCPACKDSGNNGCDACEAQGWMPVWRYQEYVSQ